MTQNDAFSAFDVDASGRLGRRDGREVQRARMWGSMAKVGLK